MTVKERMLAFIASIEMKASQFEKAVGLSNGYINNIRKGIGEDALNKIEAKYPQLNKIWLLHGEGEMIKKIERHSKDDSLDRIEAALQIINANLVETRKGVELNQALSQANLYQGARLESLATKGNHHSILKRLNEVAAGIFRDNEIADGQTSEEQVSQQPKQQSLKAVKKRSRVQG